MLPSGQAHRRPPAAPQHKTHKSHRRRRVIARLARSAHILVLVSIPSPNHLAAEQCKRKCQEMALYPAPSNGTLKPSIAPGNAQDLTCPNLLLSKHLPRQRGSRQQRQHTCSRQEGCAERTTHSHPLLLLLLLVESAG
jgi:hypothetical protein